MIKAEKDKKRRLSQAGGSDMTIQEAEEKTGLSRSNIRFYEKEGLFSPKRDGTNGYRNYSEEDVEAIRKIVFLRSLGISVDEIRKIIQGQLSLCQVVECQSRKLQENLKDVQGYILVCERLIKDGPVSFEELDTDKYTNADAEGWNIRRSALLRYDFAGLLYRLSSLKTWKILWILSLMISILSYPGLPAEIPIQWNGGEAVTTGARISVFVYPVVLIVWRLILIPWLYITLGNRVHKSLISEYAVNAICFTGVSVEIFSVLQAHRLISGGVFPLLAADAGILLILLLLGLWEINRKPET